MNTWCVFYHSIQGNFHWTPSWTRIRKKLLFLKDHVGFVKICNSSTSTVLLAKTSGHIASNPFLQEIRHTKRDPPNKKQKGASSIRCFATRDPLLLWTLVTLFADTEFSFTVPPKTTYLGNTSFLLGESSKTFEWGDLVPSGDRFGCFNITNLCFLTQGEFFQEDGTRPWRLHHTIKEGNTWKGAKFGKCILE